MPSWYYELKTHHRLSERVSPLLKPLIDAFHLEHISYFSVDDQGNSSCLCSSPSWMEFYLSEKLYLDNPFLKHPDVLQDGAFWSKRGSSLSLISKSRGLLKGFSLSHAKDPNRLMDEIPLLKKAFVLTVCCLHATPKAVVFDYGGVLTSEPDTKPAVSFLCESFGLSLEEYEAVNREKKRALKEGKFDAEFWMEYARNRGIDLPLNWHYLFVESLRAVFPLNQEMMKLARELKQKVHVALLSKEDQRMVEDMYVGRNFAS